MKDPSYRRRGDPRYELINTCTNSVACRRLLRPRPLSTVFRFARGFAGLTLLAAAAACGLQAEIIQARHWDLNEAIRETKNEQLLLNLVRLRYDEEPYFLQLSSITTNFSAGVTAGATGTIPQGGSNVLGLSGGLSYSESPSVTWSIPDSREFLGRFYAPIGTDQLSVLATSGFNFEAVFRVGTNKINTLRNREFEAIRGEFVPPSYGEFVEALRLIDELRRDGLLDLTYALMSSFGGPTFPISRIDARAVSEGVPKGVFFFPRPERPGTATALVMNKPLFIRFSLESDRDPRARRVRDLLRLDPKSYSFPITDTTTTSPEGLRTEAGRVSTLFDPNVQLRHIMLNNRSVMEILRFAAASVDVPEDQLARGVVRDRDVALDEYLDVHWSASEPQGAWLKVKYRGKWFYISSDDLRSRTSFSLISALFAAVVGEVPGAKPVLTLPVN